MNDTILEKCKPGSERHTRVMSFENEIKKVLHSSIVRHEITVPELLAVTGHILAIVTQIATSRGMSMESAMNLVLVNMNVANAMTAGVQADDLPDTISGGTEGKPNVH